MPETEEDESTAAVHVVVPRIPCPLSDADYSELAALHSPVRHSDAFGIDVYISVVEFIAEKLGCNTGFMLF